MQISQKTSRTRTIQFDMSVGPMPSLLAAVRQTPHSLVGAARPTSVVWCVATLSYSTVIFIVENNHSSLNIAIGVDTEQSVEPHNLNDFLQLLWDLFRD
jgi:hypothetical protein